MVASKATIKPAMLPWIVQAIVLVAEARNENTSKAVKVIFAACIMSSRVPSGHNDRGEALRLS